MAATSNSLTATILGYLNNSQLTSDMVNCSIRTQIIQSPPPHSLQMITTAMSSMQKKITRPSATTRSIIRSRNYLRFSGDDGITSFNNEFFLSAQEREPAGSARNAQVRVKAARSFHCSFRWEIPKYNSEFD